MEKNKFKGYLSTLADKMIEGKTIDFKNISKEAKEKSFINEMSRKTVIKKLLSEEKFEEAKYFIIENKMQNFVDSKGKTMLCSAIATNNFNLVNFLIENGSIVTSTDLNYCVVNDVDMDIIVCLLNKLILESTQEQDEKIKEEVSKLLEKAISCNNLELANLIYVSNLYSNSYDVLNTCLECDNLDFAKYILELGFDLNTNANKYFNLALSKDSLEWLKLLFKHNINIDKDNVSEILSISIRKKDNKVASILFDSKRYSKMYDLLNCCLIYDNLEFAKYVLEHGFDVNFNAENYFNTALRKSTLDYLKLLLEHNIALDKHYSTIVLSKAIREKNNDLAALLFNTNTYISSHDILCDCLLFDNIEFAEYLLTHGINVNYNCEYYFNMALTKDNLEWLQLLFKYDIKLEPNHVSMTLTNSIREGNDKLATLLYQSKKYLSSHDVLYDCIVNNNLNFAQYILCSGFDVNFNSVRYLESALWKSSSDFLKLLINHNIDLEKYGHATMNYAIELEKIRAIDILSKAGIKIKNPSKLCTNLIKNKQLMITVINLCENEDEILKIFDIALKDNIIIAEYILKKHVIKVPIKKRLHFMLKKIFN